MWPLYVHLLLFSKGKATMPSFVCLFVCFKCLLCNSQGLFWSSFLKVCANNTVLIAFGSCPVKCEALAVGAHQVWSVVRETAKGATRADFTVGEVGVHRLNFL